MIPGKRLLVLGGGESGVGAAILGKRRGWDVFLSEKGALADSFQQTLQEESIPFESGAHHILRLMTADVVVKSPGIPDSAPVVKKLLDSGKTIISEIEFASWYTQSLIIGITGTNGKTTTTRLIWHLLHCGGVDAGLAGNIGRSFAAMVALDPHPVYVLELSSFQLEGVRQFRPDIALLLNITPDHMDRYRNSMESYAMAKFQITANQRPSDLFLINGDDLEITSRCKQNENAPRLVKISQSFSCGNRLEVAGYLFSLENTVLMGRHNALNAAFAIQAALAMGVNSKTIQEGLLKFRNDPHRLEKVASADGVVFINDSKGTNVDAVYYALEAMQQPVVWLAGGLDKGNDYGQLKPLMASRVKALIAIGADNRPLKRAFGKMVPYMEIADMQQAVREAHRLALPEGTVLLSPACASFDLYRNYEDRGNQFRAAVHQLQGNP